jgi:hypothetical protein
MRFQAVKAEDNYCAPLSICNALLYESNYSFIHHDPENVSQQIDHLILNQSHQATMH